MLTIRGPRPDDRDRLLAWRNAPRVREVSIDDHEIDADAHARWFAGVLARDDGGFLVVEERGRPVGVVRADREPGSADVCSWSCHLGVDALTPGVGAGLPVLGLGVGFVRLGARRLVAEVLSNNRNMRAVHRRLGIEQEGVRREQVVRASGATLDVHEYGVLRAEWPSIRDRGLAMLPSAVRGDLGRVLDELLPGDPGSE